MNRYNQVEEITPIYCSFCGGIMLREGLPSEKPKFKCITCGSYLFYGKIINSHTGEPVETITINLGFNLSSNQTKMEES